jgi:hypothetical protein
MCNGNNDNFVDAFAYNDVVWESPQNETFRAALSCHTRCWGKRHDLFLEQIERGIYGQAEFGAETRTLQFIPSGCFGGFVSGSIENSNPAHQMLRKRSSI